MWVNCQDNLSNAEGSFATQLPSCAMQVTAKTLKAAVSQRPYAFFSVKLKMHRKRILEIQDTMDMQPFQCNSRKSMHQL